MASWHEARPSRPQKGSTEAHGTARLSGLELAGPACMPAHLMPAARVRCPAPAAQVVATVRWVRRIDTIPENAGCHRTQSRAPAHRHYHHQATCGYDLLPGERLPDQAPGQVSRPLPACRSEVRGGLMHGLVRGVSRQTTVGL